MLLLIYDDADDADDAADNMVHWYHIFSSLWQPHIVATDAALQSILGSKSVAKNSQLMG